MIRPVVNRPILGGGAARPGCRSPSSANQDLSSSIEWCDFGILPRTKSKLSCRLVVRPVGGGWRSWRSCSGRSIQDREHCRARPQPVTHRGSRDRAWASRVVTPRRAVPFSHSWTSDIAAIKPDRQPPAGLDLCGRFLRKAAGEGLGCGAGRRSSRRGRTLRSASGRLSRSAWRMATFGSELAELGGFDDGRAQINADDAGAV